MPRENSLAALPAITNEIPSKDVQYRPLCVKRLPEAIWLKVHDNAHRSRMRLQEYLAVVLKNCEPVLKSQPGTLVVESPTAAMTVDNCPLASVIATLLLEDEYHGPLDALHQDLLNDPTLAEVIPTGLLDFKQQMHAIIEVLATENIDLVIKSRSGAAWVDCGLKKSQH